jgi:hypothetical protein
VCATNRIVVEIRHGERSATVAFEELNRQLRIKIDAAGWLATLDPAPRRAMATSLIGLAAMSNVDLALDNEGLVVNDAFHRVSWSAWVRAWEADAAGLGHPDDVAPGPSLLDDLSVSEEQAPRR